MNGGNRNMVRYFGGIVSCVASVVMLPLLCASAYGGMIDPEKTPIPAILSLTFPILLCVTLGLTAVNLLFYRKTALINIASIAICASPIYSFCPIHFGHVRLSEEQKEHSFTIMTYNVLHFEDFTKGWDGKSENPTLAYIISKRPDIVALQECQSLTWTPMGTIPAIQIDSLKSIYPYISVKADGQSLLSKYPFKELESIYPADNSFIVREYQLDVRGKQITLFNVHLRSIGLTEADKKLYVDLTEGNTKPGEMHDIKKDLLSKLAAAFRDRASQAHKIREMLDTIGGNTIVCGDFNDIPGCYAQRVITGDNMTDAYREAGRGPAITYHANRFYFRIDHILYDKTYLKLASIRKGKSPYSDHYPLIARFSTMTDNRTTENNETTKK